MKNYLALFIPVLLLLIGIEYYIHYRRRENKYNQANTVMNLAIGLIDQLGALFYLAFMYVCLDYAYKHWSLVHLKLDWKQWLIAFVAIDFISYWFHRFSHTINILWAAHVTHHSSELYNLSNSFRTSLFQGLNRIAFWIILPIFGFSPLILIALFKITGIYEFFQHLASAPTYGPLQKFLITPQLHSIHHGKNECYIDKNYGSIFVIWDKLFGTYQPYTEKVEYGIKGNYQDNNAIHAVLFYYQEIWQQIRKSKNWIDKISVPFLQPGQLPNSYNEAVTKSLIRKIPQAHTYKLYANFLILTSALGFVLYLFYLDFLPYHFAIYAGITLLFSICIAVLIYKNNLPVLFKEMEFIRIATMLANGIIIHLYLPCALYWYTDIFWLLSFGVIAVGEKRIIQYSE